MARDVDGVVNTAQNPEITVRVHLRAVAGLVAAEAREVGLVFFLIVEYAEHHAGPGFADHQMARTDLALCPMDDAVFQDRLQGQLRQSASVYFLPVLRITFNGQVQLDPNRYCWILK